MINNYETACAYFAKNGYNDECELVDICNGKLTVRCKEHGHEFIRDVAVLTKPQKKLRCPECYKRMVSEVLDYYKSGRSRNECAERFGVTPSQVMNFARIHRVSGGMSKEKLGEFVKAVQAKASAKSAELAHERARERALVRNNEKRIRSGFAGIKADVDEWRKSLKAISDIQSSKQAAQRLAKVEREIGSMQAYEPKIATCRHCGKQWLFWPSRERYGRKKPGPYCSNRCRIKHNKQPSNIGHRLRKYGSADKPRDVIHLRDLYERDGGICQICGEPTNWNDYTIDADGNFIVGLTYPTHDHVIPIAKGGAHTWDNSQLAHKVCNCTKKDKIQEGRTA